MINDKLFGRTLIIIHHSEMGHPVVTLWRRKEAFRLYRVNESRKEFRLYCVIERR